jgi:hypothetical protein
MLEMQRAEAAVSVCRGIAELLQLAPEHAGER